MIFPNLSEAKYVTLDLETCDPDIKTRGPGWPTKHGHIAGIAVGTNDLKAEYYPIGHEAGGNFDKDKVLAWVQTEILNGKVPIVGHNVNYDYGWLGSDGLRGNAPLVCTQIAAALLDEDQPSYSLDNLCKVWLGEAKSEEGIRQYAEAHGLDPKADLWKMPPEVVGPYACQDTDLAGRLWRHEQTRIEAEGLQEICNLEMGLIPLFVAMRRVGVRIDQEALDRADDTLRHQEHVFLSQIQFKWGAHVRPFAARDVAQLCDKVGIRYPLTRTGLPSITSDWLRQQCHEATDSVLRARRLSKARGTFIRSYKEHLVNGRIHAQINQLRSDDGGTISGRLSYSSPNLQQVPHRDPDLAPIIRRLFLPESGSSWISSDYSQQEPRLATHYAFKLGLSRADEVVRQMRADPRLDFHQMVADMSGFDRTVAKQINLAIIYGMGRRKYSWKYGITEAEAAAQIDQHRERLPFMRQLATICTNRAESRGIVKTILGRPCRFNLMEGQRRQYTYTALNRLIQGSAADQTKKAMLMMWREGIIPNLQIHDEVCSSGDTRTARRLEEIMIEAVPLEVPVVVDTAMGANWAEAE